MNAWRNISFIQSLLFTHRRLLAISLCLALVCRETAFMVAPFSPVIHLLPKLLVEFACRCVYIHANLHTLRPVALHNRQRRWTLGWYSCLWAYICGWVCRFLPSGLWRLAKGLVYNRGWHDGFPRSLFWFCLIQICSQRCCLGITSLIPGYCGVCCLGSLKPLCSLWCVIY